MNQQKITVKELEELIPYIRNARTHSDEQIAMIAGSIKEFGWTNPVLLDGENGIIAGHGRVLAARKLGINKIPCIELNHLTQTQKRAYIIADNRLAEQAGWDNELLALELEELKLEEFDLDLIGFSDADMNALLQTDAMSGSSEDKIIEVTDKTISEPGDIWQCGEHYVMCGDSTDEMQIGTLLQGNKADLIITDPPYNVAYEGGTSKKLTIKNDRMESENFYHFLLGAYKGMFSAAKDGASIYVFHSDKEWLPFRKAMIDSGFKLSQCCIWMKQSFVVGRQDYHWQHEPVLYGWKPTGAHHWYGDRKQSTIWHFDRPIKNDIHPTMKPVSLIEYMLDNSSQAQSIVLDPFGGSGSTLIACEKKMRKSHLMELDPKYCDAIVRRWQEYTGKIAYHLKTGQPFSIEG